MRSRARPRLVTCLSLGVLIFSIIFLIRLIRGLGATTLPPTLPRWYLPLTGALWGLSGLVAAVGLLYGRAWARQSVLWGAGAFALWYWSDRLWLVRTDYARLSWPMPAIITVFALAGVLWILNRPSAHRFFGRDA